MTNKKEKLKAEFKDLNFLLSPQDQIIKADNVFGLGLSRYIPATNTIQILGYSSNPMKSNENIIFLPPFFHPTFSHEMAHYQLTMGSRLGQSIRKINLILDGLCLLIIKKMINKHKRIWIPFNLYFEYEKKDRNIEKLIRYTLRLDAFENSLISGQQISQELFAYSIVGFLTSLIDSVFMHKIRKKEVLINIKKTWSLFYSSEAVEKINEINLKLESFFAKKGINIEKIEDKEIEEIFSNLENIFGEDSGDVESILKFYELLYYFSNRNSRYKEFSIILEKFEKDYNKKTTREYKNAFKSHMEAVRILNKWNQLNISDLAKNALILVSIFCAYSPPLDPKKITNSLQPPRLKKIDEILEKIIEDLNKKDFLNLDINKILSTINNIYRKINSIGLNDLRKTPLFHIFGTPQWFNELINSLNLKRKEKSFIKNMLTTYFLVDISQLPRRTLPRERILEMIPITYKLIIKLMFKMKNQIKQFDWGNKLFSILEKVSCDNSKTIFKLTEIFQNIFFTHPFQIIENFSQNKIITPPFILYINPNQQKTILYSNNNFDHFGKLNIYRHIIGSIKELCLRGFTYSVICPLSCLPESEPICKKEFGKCWFYKIFKANPKKGHLLICAGKEGANFIRIQHKNYSKVWSSNFKIESIKGNINIDKLLSERSPIKVIWLKKAKKLNFLLSKNGQDKREISKDEYDGDIEDVLKYYEKKGEKLSHILDPIIKTIFFPIYLPFLIDQKIHNLLLKHKLKGDQKKILETKNSIENIFQLISQVQ